MDKKETKESKAKQVEIFNKNFRGKVFRFKNVRMGYQELTVFESFDNIYADFSSLEKAVTRQRFRRASIWDSTPELLDRNYSNLGRLQYKNTRFPTSHTFSGLLDFGPWKSENETTHIDGFEYTKIFNTDVTEQIGAKHVYYDQDGQAHQTQILEQREGFNGLGSWRSYGGEKEKWFEEGITIVMDETLSKPRAKVLAEIEKEEGECLEYLERAFAEQLKREFIEQKLKSTEAMYDKRIEELEKKLITALAANEKLKDEMVRKVV